MKTYKSPVVRQMAGVCQIEAESLEEAIQKAQEGPLPNNRDYIEDSFEVDFEGIPYHNTDIV